MKIAAMYWQLQMKASALQVFSRFRRWTFAWGAWANTHDHRFVTLHTYIQIHGYIDMRHIIMLIKILDA